MAAGKTAAGHASPIRPIPVAETASLYRSGALDPRFDVAQADE